VGIDRVYDTIENFRITKVAHHQGWKHAAHAATVRTALAAGAALPAALATNSAAKEFGLLLIEGPPMGKSHCMLYAVTRLRREGHRVVYLPRCTDWNSATTNLERCEPLLEALEVAFSQDPHMRHVIAQFETMTGEAVTDENLRELLGYAAMWCLNNCERGMYVVIESDQLHELQPASMLEQPFYSMFNGATSVQDWADAGVVCVLAASSHRTRRSISPLSPKAKASEARCSARTTTTTWRWCIKIYVSCFQLQVEQEIRCSSI